MLKKKKEYAVEFLKENIDFFQCPTCQQSFSSVSENGLVCQHKHHFNLSKQGVIHFPNHHLQTDYDSEMLTHRRQMIRKGLYGPVLEEISNMLPPISQQSLIVDMGCGEGSFLYELATHYSLPGVKTGFDLSKDGVQLATDYNQEAFWFIGDVTCLPFKDEQVDVLLNIFSPCQYNEVRRVLSDTGVMIKVIPEAFYLKELREAFYLDQPDKQTYSNDNVYEKFTKEMDLVKEKRLTYDVPVLKEDFPSILKMSPIHWGASKESLNQVMNEPFQTLTIDVKILIGKIHKD